MYSQKSVAGRPRWFFLSFLAGILATCAAAIPIRLIAAEDGRLRVETSGEKAGITFLSWDTETGQRIETNLLRTGQAATLKVCRDGIWTAATELPTELVAGPAKTRTYRLAVAADTELVWTISATTDRMAMTLSCSGPRKERVEGVQILVPFDPQVTPTTVLPSDWSDDGVLRLPAVISAPISASCCWPIRRGAA